MIAAAGRPVSPIVATPGVVDPTLGTLDPTAAELVDVLKPLDVHAATPRAAVASSAAICLSRRPVPNPLHLPMN